MPTRAWSTFFLGYPLRYAGRGVPGPVENEKIGTHNCDLKLRKFLRNLRGLRAILRRCTCWASPNCEKSPCPKATLALVRRIEDVLDIPVPLGNLVEESRAWEVGVNELAEDDEEVADYVRQLEEARDTTELPEASGEAIAREFERYLRRRDTT